MASSTLVMNHTLPSIFPQAPPSSCPSCGHDSPFRTNPSSNKDEAHRRIADLEAQVKLLNSKAAAAVDKLADYEDEVRYLRAAYSRSQQQQANEPTTGGLSPPLPPLPQQSRLSSLSALLPGRRREASSNPPVTPATTTFSPLSNNTITPPQPSFALGASPNHSAPNLVPFAPDSSPPQPLPPSNRAQSLTLTSLQSSLETERTLRMRAETNLTQTQTELEELTAQLFGQANEMVATERKARAKLEERVKVLETRDAEKRRRLERLEKALERIERVRGLVG